MSTVLKQVCASGNRCELGNLVKHILPAGCPSVFCKPMAGKPGDPVTNLKNDRRPPSFFLSKYFKYCATYSKVLDLFQSPWSKSMFCLHPVQEHSFPEHTTTSCNFMRSHNTSHCKSAISTSANARICKLNESATSTIGYYAVFQNYIINDVWIYGM